MRTYKVWKGNFGPFATVILMLPKGASSDPESHFGLAHFYEHIVFKSSTYKEEVYRVSHKYGIQLNAFTSEDVIVFTASGMYTNVALMTGILFKLFFGFKDISKEDFLNERSVVLREIDEYATSSYEGYINAINKILYKGSSYSNPILGYYDTVFSTKESDLLAFHKEAKNSNLVLAISYDRKLKDSVVMDSTLPLLERFGFRKENSFPVKPLDINTSFPSDDITYHIDGKDQMDSMYYIIYFNLNHLLSSYNDKGKLYELMLYLRMISVYYSGGQNSIMFENVRENLGITYGLKLYPRFLGSDLGLIFEMLTATQYLEFMTERFLEYILSIFQLPIETDILEGFKILFNSEEISSYRSSYSCNVNNTLSMFNNTFYTPEQYKDFINKVSVRDLRDMVDRVTDSFNIEFLCYTKKRKALSA